jgi:hypothetical protein
MSGQADYLLPASAHHSTPQPEIMRKLAATLFTSMDDVVEAPDDFVRDELYEGLPAALDTIAQLKAQPGAHYIRLAQRGVS